MRRRDFIQGIAISSAWPLAARAQQRGKTARVGVLTLWAETDRVAEARFIAFKEELQKLGWTDGLNVRIEFHWAADDESHLLAYATELVRMTPDVILAVTPPALNALRQDTQSIPIVFVLVADPVGGGFVKNLAKPGANVTGFSNFEYGMAGKWLELLKAIAPHASRVAVIHNPTNPTAGGFLRETGVVASSLGMRVTTAAARDAAEIERAVIDFAREPDRGVIVLPDSTTSSNRELLIALETHNRLPMVVTQRYFAAIGGLVSYGPDVFEQFRQAASYVDRILKGAQPADLPVQTPTKFELVINLKTAKALGLSISSSLLATADEVIE
jgi:putative ABC transport system substrate-binding protein